MESKHFLNVNDVAIYMGISVPTAYKLIRKMNDELKEKGFLTVSGKVSRAFFSQKIYGVVPERR